MAGVPTDPTTVTFKIIEPDGLETTVANVNDSAGVYHVDFTISKEGRHFYTWAGTGVAVEAGQGEFYALQRKTS